MRERRTRAAGLSAAACALLIACKAEDEKADSGANTEVCGPPVGAEAISGWRRFTDPGLGAAVGVTATTPVAEALLFSTGASLYRQPLEGGEPTELQQSGAAANAELELIRDGDGALVRSGLDWWRYPAGGGAPRAVALPAGYAEVITWEAEAEVLWAAEVDYIDQNVAVVQAPLGAMEATVALPAQDRGTYARWLRAPSGALFTQGGGAQDFDPTLYRFVDGVEEAVAVDPPVGALLGVDGDRVLYVGEAVNGQRSGLYALPVDGAAATALEPALGAARAAWPSGDGLLIADEATLWLVPPGGAPEAIAALPAGGCAHGALSARGGVVYGATQRLDDEATVLWALRP